MFRKTAFQWPAARSVRAFQIPSSIHLGLLIAVVLTAIAMTTGSVLADGCQHNFQCGKFMYCKKQPGDCDGVGVCSWRLDACPDYYDPVCGCDGNTYSNACYAGIAGVNVAYHDACSSSASSGGCQTNFDCNWWSEFCRKDQGDCDGVGQCAVRPMYCLDVWIPVCGCNGQTYSNDCYAHRSGVNVAHQGGCNGEGGGPVILMGSGDHERVGAPHLLALLNHWGECDEECPFDLTGDGTVEIQDLLILLNHWGWQLE